jgi:hypothetical protein
MRIALAIVIVAVVAMPGLALQGVRQGCLSIDNRSHAEYEVILENTNVGTYAVQVPARWERLIGILGRGKNAKMVVVSEESTYSAVADNGSSIGEMSLKEDPNTLFRSPLRNPYFPQCYGGWSLLNCLRRPGP